MWTMRPGVAWRTIVQISGWLGKVSVVHAELKRGRRASSSYSLSRQNLQKIQELRLSRQAEISTWRGRGEDSLHERSSGFGQLNGHGCGIASPSPRLWRRNHSLGLIGVGALFVIRIDRRRYVVIGAPIDNSRIRVDGACDQHRIYFRIRSPSFGATIDVVADDVL